MKSAFKSGEASDRGNYRILTMLYVLSKVSETVICDQLDNQVEKTRHKNQWAYRKGIFSLHVPKPAYISCTITKLL